MAKVLACKLSCTGQVLLNAQGMYTIQSGLPVQILMSFAFFHTESFKFFQVFLSGKYNSSFRQTDNMFIHTQVKVITAYVVEQMWLQQPLIKTV